MKRIGTAVGLIITIALLASCTAATKPAKPTAVSQEASPSPTIAATVAVPATPTIKPTVSAVASPTAFVSSIFSTLPTSVPKAPVTPARILEKAAAARGLSIKSEVPFTTLSRAELRPYLVTSFEKDHGKEDLEKEKALWQILDLIGEKEDLYDLWLGLLSEQVAGFYDLDEHSMTLVGSGGALSTMDELTLAHEYVHALQDQNFNTSARAKQIEHDGEKSLALLALVEGDATLSMVDYATKNMSRQDLASLQNEAASLDMQKLDSAPPVLQMNLLFPYEVGAAFVANLFLSGGWTAVNKAYADPPTTSEQIIHPEKYKAGEGPQRVDLPEIASVLGEGWQKLDSGAFGELGWMVYLAQGLGPEEAVPAAEGWGGDQYILFRSKTGKLALVELSSWDTQADADELFTELYFLQDTHDATEFTRDEDTSYAWTRSSTVGYASIKGSQVLLVITPDEATTKKIVGRFGGF